ncbi:T9SS type A sorting domain-containing protein, partial [candidate division KSB1 bacterium]|nr:T9SS type A sorting domain-containing protein [candidate division KSB1 bacterium]
MNSNLRWFSIFVLLMLLTGTMLFGAINGENKFVLVGEVPQTAIGVGLYDIVSLPDLNNNGLEEVFVCADLEPEGAGTGFYILERGANNELVKVWEYNYTNSYYSYGVEYGDVDGDGLIEIIGLCSASAGQKGVVFFEVDPTITDKYPLPATPTYEFDITGKGLAHGPYQGAIGNIDTDPNNELIVADYEANRLYVLEELNGDISNPTWHYELIDSSYGNKVTAATIGDFDNDGFKDFAVAARPDCRLVIYENAGEEDKYDIRFDKKLKPGAGSVSAYRALTYYDFNGDFIQELIYCNYQSTGEVWIIDNPGELAGMTDANVHQIAALGGRLTGCTTGNHEFTPSAAVYDGRDIYLTTRDGGKVFDIEYVGGKGVFDAADPKNYVTYTIYTNASATPRGVAAHKLGKSPDYDGDGRGDLVIIGTGGNSFMRLLEHEPANQLGLNIAYQDPSTKTNPNDPIKGNPRGCVANVDLDQDGKKEIYITQYTGKIFGYEATGNNNELEWVWGDTTGKKIGLSSSPRDFAAGDIDGNGRGEVFHWTASNTAQHPDSAGLWFYEWDGVNDNGIGLSQGVPYAGGPTYIYPQNLIDPAIIKGYTCEYFDAGDVDQDGKTEFLMPNNGSGSDADACIVLHCVDGTLDSGFPTFKADVWLRSAYPNWGGSTWGSVFGGDTDGDGHKEAIFMIWDQLTLFFAEYISQDSVEVYETAELDTLREDGVFYNSIGIGDLDGDGDDEIVGLIYATTPRVVVINPPKGDLTKFDMNDPKQFSTIRKVTSQFGGELGDPNRDGKWDFMMADYRRSKISALTLTGTDPMDPNSWIESEAFYDDSWVPIPTPADYDSTQPSPNPSYGNNLYTYMLYHWNDGVHSLTDGSFAVKQLEDYDQDGEWEIWINTLQSPFSDSWFLIAEATDVGIKISPWKVIMPEHYVLDDAYPNPFNANCTIKYSIPLDKNVNIKIYNMLGQVVKILVDNEFQFKGEHKVIWDGSNDYGMSVASGTYIYSLEVGKHIKHTK